MYLLSSWRAAMAPNTKTKPDERAEIADIAGVGFQVLAA